MQTLVQIFVTSKISHGELLMKRYSQVVIKEDMRIEKKLKQLE